MSDAKDWSKVDDDELDDAVADGDYDAMAEAGMRQAHELSDLRARLATLTEENAELRRDTARADLSEAERLLEEQAKLAKLTSFTNEDRARIRDYAAARDAWLSRQKAR